MRHNSRNSLRHKNISYTTTSNKYIYTLWCVAMSSFIVLMMCVTREPGLARGRCGKISPTVGRRWTEGILYIYCIAYCIVYVVYLKRYEATTSGADEKTVGPRRTLGLRFWEPCPFTWIHCGFVLLSFFSKVEQFCKSCRTESGNSFKSDVST